MNNALAALFKEGKEVEVVRVGRSEVQSKRPQLKEEEVDQYKELLGRNFGLFKVYWFGNRAERIKARQELIMKNLPFVCTVLRGFANVIMRAVAEDPAMDWDDIFQEAMLGMTKAVVFFDPRFGKKFTTFVSFWVIAHFRRAIDRSGLIRAPVRTHIEWRKLVNAANLIEKELGKEVDLWNTSAEVLEALSAETGFSQKKIQWLSRVFEKSLYLDDSVPFDKYSGDGRKRTWAEIIAFDSQAGFIGPGELEELREAIDKFIMVDLKPREKEILQRRFGLLDGESETLEEIGEDAGLSKERVRHIQKAVQERVLARLEENPQTRAIFEEYMRILNGA